MAGGFNPAFDAAVQAFLAAAPNGGVSIKSGYRTPERQAQLWESALAKYGSPEAARKWVAPPGRSMHNHGYAADLGYADPSVLKWAHENAPKFGLAFPLSNENWHVELAGARNGGQPQQAAAAVDPQPQAAPPDVQPFAAAAAAPVIGGLTDLFATDPEQDRKRRAAEDRRRRLALFG